MSIVKGNSVSLLIRTPTWNKTQGPSSSFLLQDAFSGTLRLVIHAQFPSIMLRSADGTSSALAFFATVILTMPA